MKRRVRIFWSVIAVLTAMAGVLALLYRVGSRSELARYKAALRARGEKLTLAELAVPPSTNAEEVASRAAFTNNPLPSGEFLVSSMMEFIGPGKARVAWRGNLHWDGQAVGNSNHLISGNWDCYDQTNALIAPSMEKIRPALAHPAPDEGVLYKDSWETTTNIPRTWVRKRIVAYGFVHTIIADLHKGHPDAAIENLFALAAMARMDRNELLLVHQMVRTSVARLGLKATWEALQAPGWDEPRLKMLQDKWEQVNLIDALERGLEGERAFVQVLFQEVRRRKGPPFWELFNISRPPSGGGRRNKGFLSRLWSDEFWTGLWRNEFLGPAYKITSMNQDELLCLRHESEVIEALRTLKTNRPAPEVETVTTNLIKELDAKFAKDRHWYIVSAMAIPNSIHAVRIAVEGETERRMAITAIAIKRHQLQHGCAPANLAALMPAFLTATPIDPMSGGPLCYRLNPDGSFTLYSVGRDGKDDGGKGGLDIWSGPDAVWPSVATTEEADAAEKAALKN